MAAKRLLCCLLTKPKQNVFSNPLMNTRQIAVFGISSELKCQISTHTITSMLTPKQQSQPPMVAPWMQQTIRSFSSNTSDFDPEIQERVLAAIQRHEKISPQSSKLTLESKFKEDLSLDSLDHVEMITMVEDEFGIEIPDKQMEKMVTPIQIVQYLCSITLPVPEQ